MTRISICVLRNFFVPFGSLRGLFLGGGPRGLPFRELARGKDNATPISRCVQDRVIPILMLTVLATLSHVASCEAGSLTAVQENFLSAALSSDIDYGAINGIEKEGGNSLTNSASLSFPYNAVGWTNTLTDGSTLNVGYTGSLDSTANVTSWTGKGSFGAQAITVSGVAAFSNDTAIWSQSGSLGSTNWSLSGPLSFQTSSNGVIGFSGSLIGTIDGIAANIPSITGDLDWTIGPIPIDFDSVHITITISSKGKGPGGGGGKGGGTLSATPEPSSLTLCGIAISCLFTLACYRKRAAV